MTIAMSTILDILLHCNDDSNVHHMKYFFRCNDDSYVYDVRYSTT